MMTLVEQEIIDRLSKLDAEAQQQVLDYVRQLQDTVADKPELTISMWLEKAQMLRTGLRAKYGENYMIGIQSILNEVREERLDDLMGGR